MENIRIDKFLSQVMNISRIDAKKLMRSGVVLLNGAVCKDAATKVNCLNDTVVVNGKHLAYNKYIYIMMNKPDGVVSASNDPKEKTVVDLVPDHLKRRGLFPAGRLDKDSTGFVLLTDDGDFAHRILAPGKHVPKTYEVTLQRAVFDDEIAELASGPVLDNEKLQPVEVTLIDDDIHLYSVILREGRYHQIKRMFAKQGNLVLSLHRVQIGGLALDDTLLPGLCRELSDTEVDMIIQNIGK